MANAIVGALRVIFGADTAEFDSAMKRTAASSKAWSTDLAGIGRQATQLGSTLTRSLTIPLIGFGAAAIKAASDFESSFAGVRKTVDATEPEFAALAQGLRDMAKEIPVSVDELNRVAESAGQLGIKKGDILAFTRTMADLGVTTNLTADEAATATAQIQNIFGGAGKDVDRFGATLVALGNAGASTEKDIIAMGLRIAGAGNQVGLTQAQVLAFASALSSVGINAEAGGSAISRTFLKINDAVAKGGGDLKEFARIAGMTGPAFKQAFETDAAGATVAFINGLSRLKTEGVNVNAVLEGVVGKNIILKDTLMRAAGAGTLLNEQLALASKAWQEQNALSKEAAERYKTLESQVKVLWNQLKDTAITLGTSLLPIMKDLIGVVTPMVTVIGQLAHWFAALPEPVRMTAVGIGALVAATGPAIWAFGQIATSAAVIIKQFTSKGLIMRVLNADYAALALSARALLAPLGAVALAIGAIWAAWKIGNTEAVKTTIAEWGLASENLTARLYRLIAGVDKMTPAQAKAAVAATAAAESALEQAKALDKTGNALKDAGDAAIDFVGPLEAVNATTSQFSENSKEAEKAAKAFAASLRALGGAEALAGAREVVSQLRALDGPLNVLPSKLEEMAARLREGAQAALLLGKSGLANDYTKLANTLSPIIMFQQRYNVTLGEYVTMTPQAASFTQDLADQMHRLGGTVITIGPSFQDASAGLRAFMSGFDMSPLTEFTQTFRDKLRGAWDGMQEGLSAALSNIPQTLANAFTGGGDIMGAVKSIVSQVGSAVGGAFGFMFGGPLGQKIGAAIGSMAGMLVNPLKKLFGIGMNDEIKKFNAEIDKSRQKLLDHYGSLERIDRIGKKVGVDLAGAWYHQGEAGKKAFEKIAAEFEAAVAKMESDLEGFRSDLDGAYNEARDLGYIFDKDGNLVSVAFDKMQQSAEEFGVDLQALGPSFQAARIAADAGKIINAFELLARGGTDAGTILFGMKDEISKLVQESIKFGTTIPANMQPWIQNLIDTGQLLDENGQAITDIGQIRFGAAIETQFEGISRKIGDLISKIDDLVQVLINNLTPALDNATRDRTVHVGWDVDAPPPDLNHGYEAPQFALGTRGALGNWWGNFGSGMNATLHGVEAVVNQGQAVPFAMDVLSRLSAPRSQQTQASAQPQVLRAVIQNHINLDGVEMKKWQLETHVTALENNERGIRSRERDALGVTS